MKVIFVTSQVITKHATMKRAAGLGAPLIRDGWEVEVLTQDHPDNRDYFASISGLTVSYFPIMKAAEERAYKEAMIARSRCDLVHICGLGWRNALRRRSDKIVLMDHVELESSLVGTSRLRRLAQYYLESWARRHYLATIAASRYLYRWVRKSNRGRVQHLPYGADFFPINRDSDGPAFLSAQKLDKFLLYCGGLHRNYGFWLLLESCIHLCQRYADFSAVIVGSGPELKAGREAVVAAGLTSRIRLPGYVPERELNHYLTHATAHVSPLNDTVADRARCPSKIPLYMMTRKPIVTCRLGEAWEYLGERGYYYTPGSQSSFQETVGRIWSAPPDEVGYDLGKISWDGLAQQYRQFWQPSAAAMERAI